MSAPCFAIIPAAGLGRRFGGTKQFHRLADRPLLEYALQAFQDSRLIDSICLVVPASEQKNQSRLIQNRFPKIQWVVAGGKERQDSVRCGLEVLPEDCWVAIHDGARPLVTQELLEKVITAAQETGAAIPALPIPETVKEVRDFKVVRTVDRSFLWQIQTPQCFRYDLLKKAFQNSQREGLIGTDESMLVERIGVTVRVVEGDRRNIKITTPNDFALAERLLGAEKRL